VSALYDVSNALTEFARHRGKPERYPGHVGLVVILVGRNFVSDAALDSLLGVAPALAFDLDHRGEPKQRAADSNPTMKAREPALTRNPSGHQARSWDNEHVERRVGDEYAKR
jgi:hypothetical protein